MCGIVGIVAPNAQSHELKLDAMVRCLRHRGPDGDGKSLFRNCALGHTRLSIVDLVGGRQPMHSADRLLAITFNGEIYGYRNLREDLSEYPYSSTSDTEVVLAYYWRYGEGCVSRLPGMFAFAIWDEQKQQLFCARDRFGEKPFYYAMGPQGEFVFASEIKAILASGLVTPVLSAKGVRSYLQHLCVGPDQTIYENIFVLPPAHTLCWRRNQLVVEQYWTPRLDATCLDATDAAVEFRRLFSTAVGKQLIADVPVGVFLSGGLDSSSVVAAASMQGSVPRTFSFAFDGDYSEAPFARSVAMQCAADHTELNAESDQLADLLAEMQGVYDEPFADSSNIPTYLLCREARIHVKVALSGDGGDELMGGYESYRPLYWMHHETPASAVRRGMMRGMQRIARDFQWSNAKSLEQRYMAQTWRSRHRSLIDAHRSNSKWLSDHELAALGLKVADELPELNNFAMTSDPLNDVMRFDLEHYLPSDILVKVDRASMAVGLEVRAPFLDVDLASFCLSLPSRLKLNDQSDKLVLREAFGDHWPEGIRTRTKQGFGAPVHEWLQRPSLSACVDRTLNNPRHELYALLSYQNCRKYVVEKSYKTWILLVLALWMETHSFKMPRLCDG